MKKSILSTLLFIPFIAVLACCLGSVLWAQEGATEEVTEDPEVLSKLRLGDAFWVSPRAEGMGGALSVFAEGLDAPYYNPAGIGGLLWKDDKSGNVKNIFFPAVGGSLNENSQELNKQFSATGGKDDAAIGEGLVNAAEGSRQYARGSFIGGAIVGRFALLPFVDAQGAAVSQGADGLVSGHFRTNSGIVTGISLANKKNTFFLGAARAYLSSTVYQGTVNYRDIIDKSARSAALKDIKTSYSAEAQVYGALWRLPKGVRPSIAAVIRHQGATEFISSKKSDTTVGNPYKIAEDVTVGFGISPLLDNILLINYVLEAHHLSDKETTLDKKIATGVEFSLVDKQEKPYLSLRSGYNIGGVTYGFGLAVSMLKIELSSYAEDVGIANTHHQERRTSALVSIDIVE